MRDRWFRLLPLLVLLAISLRSWADASDAGVEAWLQERLAGEPLSLPSDRVEDLSLERAYTLQAEVERRLIADGDQAAGYKLALTSSGARQRFGVEGAARGFLLASMAVPPGVEVTGVAGSRVFAEAEIAFVIGRRIDAPVSHPAALVERVSSVHPALELATYRFAPGLKPRLVDIVADGAGAWRYALGPGRSPVGLDMAACEAVLERDGVELGRGLGSDSLGGPWRALLWAVNHLVANGRALEAGDVVLSGALGPVQVLELGGGPVALRTRIVGLGSVDLQLRGLRPSDPH